MKPCSSDSESIYAAPKASVRDPTGQTSLTRAEWEQSARRAGIMFGLGWIAVLTAVLGAYLGSDRLAICALGACVALFAFSAVRAQKVLRRFFSQSKPRAVGPAIVVFLFPLLLGVLMMLSSALATLMLLSGGRGRQVRRFGRPVIPAIGSVRARAPGEPIVPVPPPLRSAIAGQWRANALTEHASVAAFADLTLMLVTLGAPAKLLEDAQRDGQDESLHTRLCFSLAAAIDGEDRRPGPFRHAARWPRRLGGRTWKLSRLAVESLVDGALLEGVSARVMARLATSCGEPTLKKVLRVLAADEARHAAHGWDVVEWCVAEGGRPVIASLCGALAGLPHRLHDRGPHAAISGEWEQFGVPGAGTMQREYGVAKRRLAARVMALAAPDDDAR